MLTLRGVSIKLAKTGRHNSGEPIHATGRNMPTPSQLQKTAAEFKKWRTNKNARSESTPLPLRRQAVALITQYPINQIAKALGLNGSGIKRWQAELADKDAGEPTGNESFISLPKVAPQGSCLQRKRWQVINSIIKSIKWRLNPQRFTHSA